MVDKQDKKSNTKRSIRLGRRLLEARKEKNITLEQASSDLKIQKNQLQALELGRFFEFSADVYARGAFNKYAEYLGLSNNTNHALERALSSDREFSPIKVHTPKPWLTAILTPRLILAGVILLIALVVGGYIAWQVESFVRLPSLEILEPLQLVVSTNKVTLKGRAATDSHVIVNNEQVLLLKDGFFEKELLLHAGINTIKVEAINAADRKSVLIRDILVSRKP